MKVKSGLAEEFLKFNDRSRSPYHAASSIAEILKSAGFQRISEADDWVTQLKPKGRYYFTREASSIVAFALDENFGDKNLAFALIGAHTDSPCFKVKPISKCVTHGYNQVGVECYGGGLWHTWFDRDLTVAGRVAIRRRGSETLEMKLVSVQRPILRIPNLAIHLQRNIYTEGVKINKEIHTLPILATEIQKVLNTVNGANSNADKNEDVAGSDPGKNCPPGLAGQRHAPILLDILAQELNVDVSEIVDLDLCVADTQPSAIGGAVEEFVFAPRLDNLVSCFTSAKALINSLDESSAGEGSTVRVISLFDHEEVGSDSSHGAGSPLVTDTMQRIAEVCDTSYHRAIRRSMLVSADMAHALHPNYQTAHEVRHRPKMGAGLVIKTNQNQRYATSGITGLIMREAARRGGNIPIQEFVVPNDKPCGSTIGPIVSSNTGLRTVDVGQAQLAMHSVREMCAVEDFELAESVFRAFFTHFRAIDEELAGTAEL